MNLLLIITIHYFTMVPIVKKNLSFYRVLVSAGCPGKG